MEIDHQSNLLRRTKRNPDLPSDVKRFRSKQADTKLAQLAADYSALEAEAMDMDAPMVEVAAIGFSGSIRNLQHYHRTTVAPGSSGRALFLGRPGRGGPTEKT